MKQKLYSVSVPLGRKGIHEALEELPNGHLRFDTKLQHCGIVNRNNRLYPLPVWEQHLKEDAPFVKAMRQRRIWGHIEHPPDGKPDLKKAAVLITNAYIRPDGEIYGTVETLNTTAGLNAKTLILDGVPVGFSSRAHGSVVRNNEGIDEVQMDFIPETFDMVAEPSTPGAVYIQESLEKSLGDGDDKVLIAEAVGELCEARLEALKDELISGASWCPTWEARTKEIKDELSEHLEVMEEGQRVKLTVLHEGVRTLVSHKKHVVKQQDVLAKRRTVALAKNKATINLLIEQAEQAAKEAQKAAQTAEKAATDAANQTASGDKVKVDAEVAATQAKIAAGEAEAAAKAAGNADTEVGVQAAANQAAIAAEKAKEAAQMAVASTADVAPATEPPAPEAKICHTVDVEIDFERLSDATKKKFDAFRPGEALDTAKTLISSELEAASLPVKQLDMLWSEEKIRVKVEVDGDPVKAKECIMGLINSQPVATPTTITAPAPAPSTESFASKVANRQQAKELREENMRLRQEVSRLRTENANLKILNQEMVVLFESEAIKYEATSLIRKYPSLKRIEKFLMQAKSVPALHETANQFRQALVESKKEASTTPPVSKTDDYFPSTPIIDDAELPPQTLNESDDFIPERIPKKSNNSGGDMFTRLARLKAQKKQKVRR